MQTEKLFLIKDIFMTNSFLNFRIYLPNSSPPEYVAICLSPNQIRKPLFTVGTQPQ
jgi:hypothetical protein